MGLSALVGLRGGAQQEQGSPRQALGSGERPNCLPSSLSMGEEVPTDAVIRDLIFSFFLAPLEWNFWKSAGANWLGGAGGRFS